MERKKGNTTIMCLPKKNIAIMFARVYSLLLPFLSKFRKLDRIFLVFTTNRSMLRMMVSKLVKHEHIETIVPKVLPKENMESLERYRVMSNRVEWPPCRPVSHSCKCCYIVEANGPIKDTTIIGECPGDVDHIKNGEHDDCTRKRILVLATDPSKNLVIGGEINKYGIACYFSGINNHTQEDKKKQNIKCVRYRVNGESIVFLVATRDISKGERFYFDYNGYE